MAIYFLTIDEDDDVVSWSTTYGVGGVLPLVAGTLGNPSTGDIAWDTSGGRYLQIDSAVDTPYWDT